MSTIAERYAEELGRSPEGEIPNKLRELRKPKGLTLNDVAEVLGITLGYLSQLERGENEPSLSLAVKIAKFYGKRIDEIWSFAAVEIDVGWQI